MRVRHLLHLIQLFISNETECFHFYILMHTQQLLLREVALKKAYIKTYLLDSHATLAATIGVSTACNVGTCK